MEQTKAAVYVITNKETGEKFAALPHTFGDGYVEFVKADLALEGLDRWMNPTAEELYRFENPNKDGNLTSEYFEIEYLG